MQITEARFGDAAQTLVNATIDGVPGNQLPADHWMLAGYEGEIADHVEPEARPEPVPDAVEDWQFAGQAAAENIITREAALDWAGAGIVPQKLVDAVKAVVPDETARFDLLMFLRGSKLYPRRGPYVPLLGKLFGKNDDAALDAFWIAAGRR